MVTITVKQVIPHPDGAAIIVPEDSSQRSFCLLKEQLEQLGGVKPGDVIDHPDRSRP